MAISGTGIAVVTSGSLFIYAGLRGLSPLAALKDITSGNFQPLLPGSGSAAATGGTSASAAVGVSAGDGSLLSTAVALGTAAGNTYQWGATGPDAYDCSGLVWTAMKQLGYTGRRFNTATFALSKAGTRVATPATGDVVLWTGHHMGIVSGTDQFYSAKSALLGIGYAKISTWSVMTPSYWRPRALTTLEIEKRDDEPIAKNRVNRGD